MDPISLIAGIGGNVLGFLSKRDELKTARKIAETNAITSAAITSNYATLTRDLVVVGGIGLLVYGGLKIAFKI